MSGMGTEVDVKILQNVSKEVEQLISKYKASIDKLFQLGSEVDGMWDGDASKKFMAQFQSDRERFDALTKILSQYLEAILEAIQTYIKTESEVINVLNTNKVR